MGGLSTLTTFLSYLSVYHFRILCHDFSSCVFLMGINAFIRCVTFSERQEVDDVMRWEFPFE